MPLENSPLQKIRESYQPILPKVLADISKVVLEEAEEMSVAEEVKSLFPKTQGKRMLRAKMGDRKEPLPLKVGVVFSGGQAAGGHNVLAGLFDGLKKSAQESRLWGFLDGPGGIVKNKEIEITRELLAPYRNQGGFDLLASGRTKIETEEQLQSALKTVSDLSLDGLVIIGGDDSNTNAAVLAEYFISKGCRTKVVGVPKTIDGDLKNSAVEISFGFDTACKVYSELIGNIARDALSAKKYYHFIKLMGRSASHIALECALSTHPNYTFIGEEAAASKKGLLDLVHDLADLICKRVEKGKNYGVILIPEGLLEFIPEIQILIAELNRGVDLQNLTTPSRSCLLSLPEKVQRQLQLERDPHGNVQFSLIETEYLFMELVGSELKKRETAGAYKGKFNGVRHFFGYEGRAALPSNFDCNYCYALGQTAALLLNAGATGYMCAVGNLTAPPSEWSVGAIPLASLLHIEERGGKKKPVIRKYLVDLTGIPFREFSQRRSTWMLEDGYRYPGPIQFFGDPTLTEMIPIILKD